MKHIHLILICIVGHFSLQAQVVSKPNIILIVVDDLNDYVEGYNGQPQMATPNINSLISNGYTFSNAFCNAPVCAPSRTSFMSGKDLYYTNVYDNNNYISEFRDNFTEALGNEEVISLPEQLKDKGGYYTLTINKVFHNPFIKDYDNSTPDPCLKQKSWSRAVNFSNFTWLQDQLDTYNTGVQGMNWGIIPDSLEEDLKDYRAVDTAINYLTKIVNNELSLCDSNFFMALGFDLPHLDLYVPEHYFSPYYIKDFYADTYTIPYNSPADTFPYTGIVMPPQPEIRWNDYNYLGPLAKAMSVGQGDIELRIATLWDSAASLPIIDTELDDSVRLAILRESMRANGQMAYMAAVEFIDEQIGRLLTYINSEPALSENTIIIFVSDNGFSFGEKRHWLKRSLWEPDVRIPFVIYDPKRPGNITCNSAVSLLDLYPTICELTGTPLPQFEDGSNYLDGRSIVPLLNEPELQLERPVLITFEAEDNKECSCFPQYAVRNNKYKYIKYASDGGNPYNECNSDSSFTEEELYEIGINREIDPYEWNNLIDDPNYTLIKQYLAQFLPDSVLYLQPAYSLNIINYIDPCIYGFDDFIHLQAQVYDTVGNLTDIPEGLVFKWMNNLNNIPYYGNDINFPLSSIGYDNYLSNASITITGVLTDTLKGTIYGLDYRNFIINHSNEPHANFHVVAVDSTNIQILDFATSGMYESIWWTMGDGTTLSVLNPESYTYDAPGTYTIMCNMQFGNEASCINQFTQKISTGTLSGMLAKDLYIFPNPANNSITTFSGNPDSTTQAIIFNLAGQKIYERELTGNDFPFVQINVETFSQGVYILMLTSKNSTETGIFVVAHQQ